jgi:hypothetical protein
MLLATIGSHGRLLSKRVYCHLALTWAPRWSSSLYPLPLDPWPRRAQTSICMQIAWDARQKRGLMQIHALLEGRLGPSPMNMGTRCWGENSLLPGCPLSPPPAICSHSLRFLTLPHLCLSAPGPFPRRGDLLAFHCDAPSFLSQ